MRTDDRYTIRSPLIDDNSTWACWKVAVKTPDGMVAELVEIGPSRSHRRAMEDAAWMFKREFGYDFVQFTADEKTPKQDRLFLWSSAYHELITLRNGRLVGRIRVVGAACFRWREWKNHPAGLALAWIWLHPFHRGKGLATESWPSLRERVGEFVVEPPLSRGMQKLMAKVGAVDFRTGSTPDLRSTP